MMVRSVFAVTRRRPGLFFAVIGVLFALAGAGAQGAQAPAMSGPGAVQTVTAVVGSTVGVGVDAQGNLYGAGTEQMTVTRNRDRSGAPIITITPRD